MSSVESETMECEDAQEQYELDSDSDDSDNDLEEDKKEEELRSQVIQLKKQIAENYLFYDGHVNLIAALRELKELEEARNAREAMSKVYPLSPELWLEWLRDEQNICATKEEREYIKTLFERAVKDYTSVQVWVEFVMFMIGGGNIDDTRRVAEQALTAVGTHVAEGILVWQVVLLVEKQICASLNKAEETQTDEDKKVFKKQLSRIQSLYRRLFRVPLLNTEAESLLEEASAFYEGELDPHISADIEKTQKKLCDKIPYEDELLKCETEIEKLAVFRRYIAYTQETDNPAAVQSLYERAVTTHCLDTGIWEEYVRFTLRQFQGLDYVVLPVCERSQRNCPWSATLCELHIRALQLFAAEGDSNIASKIKGALEKGLNCGLMSGSEATRMWMSYLVYLRRLIKWDLDHEKELEGFREACQQAVEMIDSSFGVEGDIDSEIPRFWSQIEGEYVKSPERVRDIWNDIIMKRNDNYKKPFLWLEFINLERSYGIEKHCRKLFRRALERVWDNVELIGDAYVRFEQESGTLTTMEEFLKRYDDRMIIVKRKRAEDAEKLEAEKQAEEARSGNQKNKGKKHQYQQKDVIRRTNGHSQGGNEFKAPFQVSKQKKGSKKDTPAHSFTETQHELSGVLKNTFQQARHSEKLHQPPGIQSDVSVSATIPDSNKPSTPDVISNNTPPGFLSDKPAPGHISNVAPPPGFTSEVPPPPGFVTNETPPKSSNRESSLSGNKRILEDSEEEPAAKVAKLSELYGVPTQKDTCDDLSTIFISNLDFSVGKKEILPIFNGCGAIKEFRLVLDFKRRSKGFGYLVFSSQDAVPKALELDRTPFNGRPIFVSKYNPESHSHNFKYATELEKNKLFIRGLPFTMKEDDIREAFQPHGDIKEIRLVTYRNGLSKGTCYIDYHDEATAEKVKLAMDGKELQGKIITVLISNPPKKSGATTPTIKEDNLGSGSKSKKTMGGRGKGMFDLMPRSLMRATNPTPSNVDTVTSAAEGEMKQKSNDDFRKMLLNK
ncbi:hypothetical protein SK128_011164 [Halocaridina rubra]|uniref:RRM domain-containing protein n=1 Tax=Halocaridina rubra TaxID=373956 RepID=A0AAN8WV41_HALRR